MSAEKNNRKENYMELVCQNLTKKYFTKKAVDGLNLKIESGHIYALLGPNGSGKSTLMKMIAGLTKPSEGSITLDNEQLSWKTKEKISYTPTEPFFFGYMKIDDVAKYYADFFEDFDMNLFDKVLSEMNLDRSMKTKSLSSGMMAKAKIAASIARRSELIMLDEPLNGIDLLARDSIQELLIKYAPENGSILISSHMVEELERMVDRTIFMKNGRLVADTDVEELRMREGLSVADKYRQLYSEEA
jgi:ABC-2 type transport system ATP-binding protein